MTSIFSPSFTFTLWPAGLPAFPLKINRYSCFDGSDGCSGSVFSVVVVGFSNLPVFGLTS